MGHAAGLILSIRSERLGPDGEIEAEFDTVVGTINSDLSIGVDVSQVVRLEANSELAFRGVTLVGDGFIVDRGTFPGSRVVRPLAGARALLSGNVTRYVIDMFGLSEKEAREAYPAEHQHLLHSVKPLRQQQKRSLYSQNWWLFAEPRPGFRRAVQGLTRYLCTVETAKHRWFTFISAQVLPEQTVVAICLADAAWHGILSSRVHLVWSGMAGATLEDRPRYSIAACFDPFPFPTTLESQRQRIRAIGEALDSHRKRQQALYPKLTITDMYNVLEKLRSGEPLDEKERVIHEQGLVSVLKQIHDDLDAAVFDAYRWPATIGDEEILERLVALNHERAEEEERGLVRWLRPEFQNPQGTKVETQVSFAEAGLVTTEPTRAGKGRKATKPAWPKDLPARVVAVRDLLAETGEATAAEFSRRYKGVKAAEAEKLLESLAAVGVAIETTAGSGADRAWRLLR